MPSPLDGFLSWLPVRFSSSPGSLPRSHGLPLCCAGDKHFSTAGPPKTSDGLAVFSWFATSDVSQETSQFQAKRSSVSSVTRLGGGTAKAVLGIQLFSMLQVRWGARPADLSFNPRESRLAELEVGTSPQRTVSMGGMVLYLITGGAGFIGSHLACALVRRGDRVRVLDNLSSGRLENLAELEVGGVGSGAPVEFLRAELADREACRAACEGAAGVFHEAAQVSVPRSVEAPEESYEVNVTGTLRLLEAARAAGVESVVFAASSAAYGDSDTLPKVETMHTNPLSPYASGKVAAEQLMAVWGRCFGLKTVCLRYFNVFGPRQVDDSPYTGVIAIFVRCLLEGRAPTIFGDGEQTRDLTYIDNVVEVNLRAIAADLEPGTVINVGGGERISINELYRAIAKGLGSELQPEYGPPRAGDVKHSLAAVDRARELLGWSPTVTWREGLEHTLAWYRERFERSR